MALLQVIFNLQDLLYNLNGVCVYTIFWYYILFVVVIQFRYRKRVEAMTRILIDSQVLKQLAAFFNVLYIKYNFYIYIKWFHSGRSFSIGKCEEIEKKNETY